MSAAEAWTLLIHAHDQLWARREIPLPERCIACQILWEAAIRLHTRYWSHPHVINRPSGWPRTA